MVTLVNRAKVGTTTTGTGTITLGPAKVGYQTLADAGVIDTNVVRYVIEDGSDFEIGTGTYTASGTTLSRTVIESSNSDAALSLSGSAVVFVSATAEDFTVLAPLASPIFTGTPLAPTATVGTNTTQVATTAFVLANAPSSSVSALTPAATVDISLASADYFTITLDQNTTFTMSNVDAGVDTFNLEITGFSVSDTTWDLTTASYDSVSYDVDKINPTGIFFKSDGTKMYVLDTATDAVHEFNLSTAWDLSTASDDVVSYSVNQETQPQDLFFKPDGTKLYIVGWNNDTVYQHSLSTAWDLSTGSYDSVSFSVGSQEAIPYGLFFKSDGTKMYIMGRLSIVSQYSLSTAWVVSSASYDSVSFDVSAQDTSLEAISFKPDGTKMFVMGDNDTIYQYSLSTAWVVSSASYDSVSFSVNSQEATPSALYIKDDGTKFYVIGETNDIAYQYTMGALVVATATYPGSFKFPNGTTPAVPLDGITDILEAQTTDGGTTFNVTQLGADFS
jgi:DNA-binding beta-propeller fold protein YncE